MPPTTGRRGVSWVWTEAGRPIFGGFLAMLEKMMTQFPSFAIFTGGRLLGESWVPALFPHPTHRPGVRFILAREGSGGGGGCLGKLIPPFSIGRLMVVRGEAGSEGPFWTKGYGTEMGTFSKYSSFETVGGGHFCSIETSASPTT